MCCPPHVPRITQAGCLCTKNIRVVTLHRATREGSKVVASPTARISRLEGIEGHARAVDARISKYFPMETFELSATDYR